MITTVCIHSLKAPAAPGELTEGDLHNCFRLLQRSFDALYGGFGPPPKFPTPHNIMFLLRYHRRTGNAEALAMAEKTLDAMAAGGIYDHLGYGFARYSTDRRWLVPHFEKMLYDNALLAMAYTEAWQVTGRQRYMTVVREILEYIAREMTSPRGGYYSAQDADSEGEEGKYYVWDKAEILEILGPRQGRLFCAAYNITEAGNFEGRNIPNLIGADLKQVANEHNLPPEQLLSELESCRQKLLQARAKRTPPHKDDKILTAWNALMIAAQAMAARVFHNEQYLHSAEKAYAFIEAELTSGGRLLARWRDGEARYPAYLDDYAYLVWACLELYAASLNPDYLVKARTWAEAMDRLFWDREGGGYFFAAADAEELIVRPKEVYDGAMPSGNSVAARELLRLARLTGAGEYEERARQILAAFASRVKEYPAGYTHFMQAALQALWPGKEVVVTGDAAAEDTQKILGALQQKFLPEVNWLWARDPAALAEAAPFAAALPAQEGTCVYVCRNFACSRPRTDISTVIAEIIGPEP